MASTVRSRRVLVWQWGRRGAGPRFAADLAAGLRRGGVNAMLSLSSRAEILRLSDAPVCAIPVDTYGSVGGLLRRLLTGPWLIAQLWHRFRVTRPDVAICAMAGPLDLLMAGVLRWFHIPYAVIVHEAEAHPGDSWQLQYRLQRHLVRHASVAVALSRHVAAQLAAQSDASPRRVVIAEHPPFAPTQTMPPPRAHGGRLRVLLFGRLLRYKGLDLLADAMSLIGDRADLEVRVVGQGPESDALDRLRAVPCVTVENRWVAEAELAGLFGWSDVVVLSHREASQSGVAAAALGAGRWIVATRVGGLPEQLATAPMATLCEPEPLALARAIVAVAGVAPTGQPVSVGRIARQWEELGQQIGWAIEERTQARALPWTRLRQSLRTPIT